MAKSFAKSGTPNCICEALWALNPITEMGGTWAIFQKFHFSFLCILRKEFQNF